MTSEVKSKSGFPAWAKLLIGLFLVGAVIFCVALGLGIAYLGKFKKEATDPAKIATVVDTIGDFGPLPKDFHYVVGTGKFGFAFISVMYSPDNTVINLTKLPNPHKEDAKVVLERQLASETAKGDYIITSKASETVAGAPMQYAQGYSKLPGSGQTMQRMTAVIVTPDLNSTILITGMTPGDKYDMAATNEYLSTIKSLKNAK